MGKESRKEREREVTQWDRARERGADREMDAARSSRWGDGVMIRSQIPLSLPPVPPAHKNLEAQSEGRKACSCKWPRCQSSSGRRRECGSGLLESATRGAYSASPRTTWAGSHLRRRCDAARSIRSPKDVTNLMSDCSEAAASRRGGGITIITTIITTIIIIICIPSGCDVPGI